MRLALAILFMAVQAQAATLYVSTTGSHNTNAPAFSTWTTAATNIQAAINAADIGDTILVAPGTYQQVTNNKSQLTLQAGNGTLYDADRTIISAGGSGRAYLSTAGTNQIIRGFTLTGGVVGNGVGGGGGASLRSSAVGATIDSCVIRGNTSSENGSAVSIYSISQSINNCIIVGNFGLYAVLFGAGGNIYNSVIEANTPDQIYPYSSPSIIVNSFYGNLFSKSLTTSGGCVFVNTSNSLSSSSGYEGSIGIGSNLVWGGVDNYIPRIGYASPTLGVGYTEACTAKCGDGGPVLVPFNCRFTGIDSSTNTLSVSLISTSHVDTNSPFGQSVVAKFNGTDNTARSRARPFSTTNFCMEGWAKFGNDSASGIFGVGGYLAGGFILTRSSSRTLYIEWGSGGANYIGPSAVQSSNVWRHFAVVSSNGAPFLYIDGATQSLARAWSAPLSLTGEKEVFFSYRPQGAMCYANQWLSDVRLWNYAKSDFSDRSNRLTGSESGLLGYWRLDETETPFTTGPFNIRNPTLQPSFMEAF